MKSNGQIVTSGVPQVGVLGPISFSIFINILNDRIESILRKTVDNIMLGEAVNILDGRTAVQMGSWTGASKFHRGTCKVLHPRQNNPQAGSQLVGKQVFKRNPKPGGAGRQVEHERITCPCNKGGQPHPGLYQIV